MIRKLLTYVVGDGLGKLLQLVTTIFLARVLGVESFGQWSFAFAISTYLILIIDAGTSLYGTREIAKKAKNLSQLVFCISIIRLITAVLIFGLILVFTAYFIFEYSESKYKITFVVLAYLSIGGFGYALTLDWVVRGLREFKVYTYSYGLSSLLMFVGCYFFIQNGDVLTTAAIKSISLISMAVFIAVGLHVIGVKINIDKRGDVKFSEWKHIYRSAVIIGGTALVARVYYNLDLAILGIFRDANEVGLYAGISVFYVTFMTLRSAIVSAVFPFLVELLETVVEKAKKLLLIGTVVGTVCGSITLLVFYLFSETFIEVILGHEYISSDSIFALCVLMFSIAVLFANTFFPMFLHATNHSRKVLALTILGALVNLIGNVLFIPSYGMKAAAITTLLSECIVFVGSILYLQKISVFWSRAREK